MDTQEPILVAENITKSFSYPVKLEILRGVTLALYPQKSVAIVGRSGEGKTTFLHILGTIDDPTTGKLMIAGQDATGRLRDILRNRHIGFIFQAFHLISDATALENVLMPLKIARQNTKKGSAAYMKAYELLEMVGLKERMHFPVTKLSGGEKQRVAIARAFACDPDIIFADEPTGNLDHQTAQEIQDLLLRCTREKGKALLLVTHNLQLAKLADECYELENGILHANPSFLRGP